MHSGQKGPYTQDHYHPLEPQIHIYMHYYAITCINAYNGWTSCNLTFYRMFDSLTAKQQEERSLQVDHNLVHFKRITQAEYNQHTLE